MEKKLISENGRKFAQKPYPGKDRKSSATLKIASFNAKSLVRMKGEVKQFLFQQAIDLICIQETLINKAETEFKIPQFKLIKSNPCYRRGGGYVSWSEIT